ncbi:hypothetical protein J3R04_004456 [Spirilliplanes yamanashiensis]|nr:hypothetical protein [Spirilliplanes yamanashiensis]
MRRGVHAATTEPETLRRWWSRWPTANIGLRTGVKFDVCDIDDAAAWHHLTALLQRHAPHGPLAATGRGWHLWFAATGAGSRAAILGGVDWRGRDATVVVPPSLHATGVRYRWLRRPTHPPPPCPPALLAIVRRLPAMDLAPAGTVTHRGAYAAAALLAETQRVRSARPPLAGRPGNRNDSLNRAAFNLGQLVAADLLDEDTVRARLTEAALLTALPPAEIRRTLASGLTAGKRHPRVRAAGGPHETARSPATRDTGPS